jgi:hypothetical protein
MILDGRHVMGCHHFIRSDGYVIFRISRMLVHLRFLCVITKIILAYVPEDNLSQYVTSMIINLNLRLSEK